MARATHTPIRNIRVPDARWDPAMAKATAQGTSLSALINEWIDEYIRPERLYWFWPQAVKRATLHAAVGVGSTSKCGRYVMGEGEDRTDKVDDMLELGATQCQRCIQVLGKGTA